MFDPLYVGTISRKDVIFWEQVEKGKQRSPLKALIKLCGHTHAVILKENLGGKKDQVIADRFKIMCNVEPMYCSEIKIPLMIRYGIEYHTKEINYLMFAAKFTLNDSKVVFMNEESYEKSSLEVKLNPKVQLEMCKILFYRYIIGTNHSSIEHIIMRNGLPMSISEIFIGNNSISDEFINICLPDCLEKTVIKQARKEVIKDFDLDIMRGILLQTRQPERDIKRHKPKGPTCISVQRLAILIEERVDIMKSSNIKDLIDSIKRNG